MGICITRSSFGYNVVLFFLLFSIATEFWIRKVDAFHDTALFDELFSSLARPSDSIQQYDVAIRARHGEFSEMVG